jgi:hypothetical protein
MASGSATSAATAIASPPSRAHSRAVSSSGPALRAASTSWAPRRAKACAVARPTPLEPPVITTTKSRMSIVRSSQPYQRRRRDPTIATATPASAASPSMA